MGYVYHDVYVGLLAPRPGKYVSPHEYEHEALFNPEYHVRFSPGRIQTVRRTGEKFPFAIIIQIGAAFHIFSYNSMYRIQKEGGFKKRHLAVKAYEEAMKVTVSA